MMDLLCSLFDVFKVLAGTIGSLVIVMAGASWVKDSDNPKKRDIAKSTIIHVFIGLLLIVVAEALVYVVFGGRVNVCT